MLSTSPRRHGFTVVEMMTVVLIIALVVSLLLLGLQGARRSARRAQCISNLRQLGRGLQNYEAQYRVLPSIHTNIWAIIADQLDQPIKVDSPAHFANNKISDLPKIYLCPSDEFRPPEVPPTTGGCSYAPNCQEAPATSATGPSGADLLNWKYSPWSNFKLDPAQNPIVSPDRLLTVRSTSKAASNTIILVECWHASNVVDVSGYQKVPLASLSSYDGSAADPTINGTSDAGAYRMLIGYGRLAADIHRTYHLKTDTYHRGQASVLFADGHVEAVDVSLLTGREPKDNPVWTRQED